MPEPHDYQTLKQRLERAEAIIRAIQSGEIDAVVLNKQVSLIRPEAELRKTEADLEANRLNFQTLFESIEDFLFIVTPDGIIRHSNPMVESVLGYPYETLKGLHINQLQPSGEDSFQDDSPLKFPERLLTRDNQIIHVETRMTMGTWSGEPVYFCLSRDVTERKRYESELNRLNQELQHFNEVLEERVKIRTLELNTARKQAEAANRAKSEFLANMSHELRTPLNGILGYTQILTQNDNLTENQQKALSVMHRSGEHLLMLINDILDLSKIEAQKMELHPEITYLDDFLDNIVEIIRIRADNKNLAFNMTKSDNVPPAIMADAKRLRQILLNLLGNAVKFTAKGSVSFDISRSDNKICFTITDTGVGISETHQKEIFQAFRQIDSDISRTEGTGLGLAISKRLISMMNSELNVKSAPGKGSVFWFSVAFPEVEEKRAESPSHKSISLSPHAGRPYKIMIVDDSAHNRLMLKEMLSRFGFQIFEACDGPDALEKSIAHLPHIILLDLVMPHMDGYEVCTQIRKMPLLEKSIVIAVSASVSEAAKKKCFAVGCNDFISKPVHMNDLLSLLVNYLNIETSSQEPEKPEKNNDRVMPPSRDVLESLNELARKGDIIKIKNQAKQLINDSETAMFGQKLSELASAFNINEIKQLIGGFLNE